MFSRLSHSKMLCNSAQFEYINDKDLYRIISCERKLLINNFETNFTLKCARYSNCTDISNFSPLVAVGRGSETQLQVAKNVYSLAL